MPMRKSAKFLFFPLWISTEDFHRQWRERGEALSRQSDVVQQALQERANETARADDAEAAIKAYKVSVENLQADNVALTASNDEQEEHLARAHNQIAALTTQVTDLQTGRKKEIEALQERDKMIAHLRTELATAKAHVPTPSEAGRALEEVQKTRRVRAGVPVTLAKKGTK